MKTFLEYVFAQYTPQLQTLVDHIYQQIISINNNLSKTQGEYGADDPKWAQEQTLTKSLNDLKYNLQDEFYDFLTASAHNFSDDRKYGIVNWPDDKKNIIDEQTKLYWEIISKWQLPKPFIKGQPNDSDDLSFDKGMWHANGFPLRPSVQKNVVSWLKGDIHPWYVFQKSNQPKEELQYLFKRYITVADNNDYKLGEMKKVDALVQELSKVESVTSIKMPLLFRMLYEGIDNIVIYYLDPKDKEAVDQAVKASGIQEVDRNQYFRSNHGVDKQHYRGMQSDTQWVARYFAQQFNKKMSQKDPTGKSLLFSIKDMSPVQAKNLIAETLHTILRLESMHRSLYDKDSYDHPELYENIQTISHGSINPKFRQRF